MSQIHDEILNLPAAVENMPSCLQVTEASLISQSVTHTVLQALLYSTSTRPSYTLLPPVSLTGYDRTCSLHSNQVKTVIATF